MKWIKAPDEMTALLAKAMEGKPCQKRTMFGYPAYFANGYMSVGLFQDKLFSRLSPKQQDTLQARYGPLSALEPMPGRPMKDYFVLPEKLYRSPGSLSRTLDEALEYVRSLPAKAKKPTASRKRPSGPKEG